MVRLSVSVASVLVSAVFAQSVFAEPTDQTAVSRVFKRLGQEGYTGTAIIMKDSKPLFAGASGFADQGHKFKLATKVDIASVSKPITAIAIFKLAEAGKLNIDDRLDRWFPDAPADKRGITLRQMLNHTSGLVDIPTGMTDYQPTNADEMASRIFADRLDFLPGTKNSYSNSGFNLLGMIIEKASGRSLFEYLETEVFKPADVAASYDPESFPASDVANAISEETESETVRQLAAARKGPFWGLWGAGGIFMSAPDLAKLLNAYLSGKIVSPRSVSEMLKDPYPAGSYAGEGLGWTVIHTRRGEDFISYTGGSGHSGAGLRYYPERKVIVATLATSKSPGAIRAARELVEPLVGRDFKSPELAIGMAPKGVAAKGDRALVSYLIEAARFDQKARVQYVRTNFAAAWRVSRGESALADKVSGLSSFWKPKINAIGREGSEVVAIVETQESEYPRLYQLRVTLTPEGLISNYTLKRASTS